MKYLNRSLRELNYYKKLLREAYGDNMGDEQDPRMMRQQPRQGMMQQQPQQGMDDYEGYEDDMSEDNMEQPIQEQPVSDTIDKIRELAIQGIAEFADDIESEQYQALKKIWLLTDKFYEDLQGDDEKKK